MATANFSYWRALPSLLLAASLALTACDTLKTRESVTSPHAKRPGAPAAGATPAPLPEITQTEPPTATTIPAPAPAQPPTFLNKELPKVGLILGPGGMKTYAEIGVLREFARARIPVHAVAGLEWGAVIGGLYSIQGQVNDAEWKSFKLKENEISNEGFLSSKPQPQAIGALQEFLNTAFASATIDRAKVEFGCPAYWSRQDRFGWMAKGTFKEAMRACVPYPPLYTDNSGVLASPFSVDDAAAWLRAHGANVIVLVNVLAQGETLPSRRAGEQYAENLLWNEIRREMSRAKLPVVTHVINVNTSGHPVTDFSGRRALMDAGSKAAADVVNKMVNLYGF